MTVLDSIAMVAFALGLIALPFSFYNFRNKPIRSGVLFAVPLVIFFVACELSQTFAQADILAVLNHLDADYQVSINGKPAPNSGEALSALKGLRWLPKNHSDPTKRIRIEVSDHSRRLELLIARDSRDPRQYWVFYPKSFITRHNDVGQIVTTAFDNF